MDARRAVRVIDAFVDELDLARLGFESVQPEATGRPAYHPSVLLKIYIYGYFNRVQSSRRQEREAQRNMELMWLAGRLAPDFKTIANFRKDNGKAIRNVCSQFIVLCRKLNLFSQAISPNIALEAPATVVKKMAKTEKIISELRSVRKLTRPSFRTSG